MVGAANEKTACEGKQKKNKTSRQRNSSLARLLEGEAVGGDTDGKQAERWLFEAAKKMRTLTLFYTPYGWTAMH